MIPIFRPTYGEEEIQAITEVIKSGWIGQGLKVEEFQDKFGRYLGPGVNCIAVDSCSSALYLAARVLSVPDSEVISTPMTFISTNHAILQNNLVPVFCDIEPDTLNIDTKKIESLITEKTSCLIVMHYGGHACDMDPIMELANHYDIKVIEDVAHGCGGEYKGKKIGTIGHVGCFSFQAVKNISTGKGGMISFSDSSLSETFKKLRWLGIDMDTWSRTDGKKDGYSWNYSVDYLSGNFTLTDLNAVLGICQLKKLENMNARRREITQKYNEAFKGEDWIEIPTVKDYVTKMSNHNYVIKISKRDKLHEFLKQRGISSSVHYVPNNHFKIYKKFKGDTPIADRVWKKLLTLPLFPTLTDDQLEFIISSVLDFKSS